MAGIVGYGAYVPRNRIKTETIARQWGKDPETIRRGRDELDDELRGRPVDHVRLPGAGRPRVEKKTRR